MQITLQILASITCEFMKYESDEYEDGKIALFLDNTDTEECPSNVGSEELDDDPFLQAARAMMTLSIMAATGSACLVGFEFFLCRICCAEFLESLAFVAASFLGGLSYLSFGSEYCTGDPTDQAETAAEDLAFSRDTDFSDYYNCSFGKGCSYNLTAIIIYFGVSIALCCTPKPAPFVDAS